MRNGERPRMRLGKGLTGRTVGIHGCGNVGKEVVRLLKPFNCEIIAYDIENYAEFYQANGVTPVSFDELIERSRSAYVAHSEDRRNDRPLRREGTGPAAAGRRADQHVPRRYRRRSRARPNALSTNKLAAACFDVFEIEPAINDALIALPDCSRPAHRCCHRRGSHLHGHGRHRRPNHPRTRQAGPNVLTQGLRVVQQM